MQSNPATYSHTESAKRIDEILESRDNDYEEVKEIPSRDRLTFTNGFYTYCSALFIDLRGSSGLPEKHSKARLAKIYRAYISECTAVLNGNERCAEVNIHGDAVWGVFNTPYKEDIDSTFSTAARLNSLMKMLNCRMRKKGIEAIKAGIGMSYGRALMIKAGYKGSAINEIVWMGDVVNEAANLCSEANKPFTKAIVTSELFHNNLNDHNRKLLRWNHKGFFEGDVINTVMDEWYSENCS